MLYVARCVVSGGKKRVMNRREGFAIVLWDVLSF